MASLSTDCNHIKHKGDGPPKATEKKS